MIRLTPRQHACLVGIAQGLKVAHIAQRLSISQASVYRALAEAGKRLGYDRSLIRPTIRALVLRANQKQVISPGMKLSEGGYITLTPRAAARGERL